MGNVTALGINEDDGSKRVISAKKIKRALMGFCFSGEKRVSTLEAACSLVRGNIAPNTREAKKYLDYLSGDTLVYEFNSSLKIEKEMGCYRITIGKRQVT